MENVGTPRWVAWINHCIANSSLSEALCCNQNFTKYYKETIKAIIYSLFVVTFGLAFTKEFESKKPVFEKSQKIIVLTLEKLETRKLFHANSFKVGIRIVDNFSFYWLELWLIWIFKGKKSKLPILIGQRRWKTHLLVSVIQIPIILEKMLEPEFSFPFLYSSNLISVHCLYKSSENEEKSIATDKRPKRWW